jgi:hypothetical protein
MRARRFLAAALLLLFPATILAKTEFFPLDQIKPGMKGVGRTCYRGSTPEEFQVEVLGIMRGMGAGANAVLARFSGGPLGQTGVFEGMSGSPVYIDGKLVGAVAFSFPFAKEAVGGITPIKQMVDSFAEGPPAGPGPRVLLKKSMLWQYQLPPIPGSAADYNFLVPPAEVRLQPALAPYSGHAMTPISTPLSLSGFSAAAIERFAPELRSLGLTVLQGSGAGSLPAGSASRAQQARDSSPIEPGSNIVVPLVRGDIDASAGGTVTHVDGDKLYAFGHMFFNLGNIELPMHKGSALIVFPSLQSSFKILETGEPVGTIRQDRNSGIYGVLGQAAKMIPIQVNLTTSMGIKKSLKFEVARDRFLTPFLVNFSLFNSIVASERALGFSTLKIKGKISIRNEKPVEIENRFSADSNSPAYASMSIAVPVNFLLAQGYKNLEFERIDVDISSIEDDRSATLDALRMDHQELKPGDAVDLGLIYKKANGEVVQDSYPVKIPPDVAPGPLIMLVADGTSLMSADAHEQGDDLIPRDLSQLIKFINNIRKNDRMYVRLFRREAGAVIRGEGLPGLPPSVLSILRSERNSGGLSAIQTSTFMEYELPASEYVVSGMRTVTLNIKP